ncbi:hypothetical protein [Methylobacterium crusticola]
MLSHKNPVFEAYAATQTVLGVKSEHDLASVVRPAEADVGQRARVEVGELAKAAPPAPDVAEAGEQIGEEHGDFPCCKAGGAGALTFLKKSAALDCDLEHIQEPGNMPADLLPEADQETAKYLPDIASPMKWLDAEVVASAGSPSDPASRSKIAGEFKRSGDLPEHQSAICASWVDRRFLVVCILRAHPLTPG